MYWRWLLWKSQYWPEEKLKELQWKLLSKTLDHCFTHVAYYRNLIQKLGVHRGDFRSLEDLSLLPILNKEDVIRHHDELKVDRFDRYHARTVRTSGTTGTPIEIYWDIDTNILELTCQWRHFSWAGYRLGDPFLDIRSRLFDVPEGFTWNWKCRAMEVSSDLINETNIQKYADLIRKYRITMWRGFPASIHHLCLLLEQARIKDVKPKIIITTSEPILSYQKNFIETWAGIPVCDNYGQMEHTFLICQCPEGGYHIAPEYGYIEFVKKDGTSAKPGEEGRIIATDLHKRVFPLIRYETGDNAVLSDRKCSCGRKLPLIEKPCGRRIDYLLTLDGRWVSGMGGTLIPLDGIRKAQLIQKRPGSLDIYLVALETYQEENDRILITLMKKKLGEGMDIRIHHVEEVPHRSPGKYQFVINHLKHDSSGS